MALGARRTTSRSSWNLVQEPVAVRRKRWALRRTDRRMMKRADSTRSWPLRNHSIGPECSLERVLARLPPRGIHDPNLLPATVAAAVVEEREKHVRKSREIGRCLRPALAQPQQTKQCVLGEIRGEVRGAVQERARALEVRRVARRPMRAADRKKSDPPPSGRSDRCDVPENEDALHSYQTRPSCHG